MQTSITTYTSAFKEVLSPSIFSTEADEQKYAEACLERYIDSINRELRRYEATMLPNGEVIAPVGTNLNKEKFREIVIEVDLGTNYDDLFNQHFN